MSKKIKTQKLTEDQSFQSTSILNSVMDKIETIEPEKAEVVTLKRYLVLVAIASGVFLASVLFTVFLEDLVDKVKILDFLERNRYEVFFKLTLELAIIGTIFTAISYFISRKAILPWTKDRLKLIITLFFVVFVIAGSTLVIIQSNTFGLKYRFQNLKEDITNLSPFNHDIDNNEDFSEGVIIESTNDFLVIKSQGRNLKFLWQDNYQPLSKGNIVIVKYEPDGNGNRIVEKVKVR